MFDEDRTVLDVTVFPLIGRSMMVARTTDVVQVFLLNFDGALRMEPCSTVPVTMSSDVEPFTINGHTYLAVASGRMITVWKYRLHREDFALHQRLSMNGSVTDVHFFRVGFKHFLGAVDEAGASVYRWRRTVFVRFQSMHLSEGGGGGISTAVWHSLFHEATATVLPVLITRDGMRFFFWDQRLRRFTVTFDTRVITRAEVENPLHTEPDPPLLALSFAATRRTDSTARMLMVAAGRRLVTFRVQLAKRDAGSSEMTDGERVQVGHMSRQPLLVWLF